MPWNYQNFIIMDTNIFFAPIVDEILICTYICTCFFFLTGKNYCLIGNISTQRIQNDIDVIS